AKKGLGGVLSYRLAPIDVSTPEDPKIAAMVADFQAMADRRYFSRFGLRAEEAIAESGFALAAEAKATAAGVDSGLGNLIADAYRAALRAADPSAAGAPLIAIQPLGLTRDDLRPGPISVGDVFRVLSLGIGEDGVVGYPLISAWVTGAELLNILEVQGTIAGLKGDAKLDVAGLRFRTNSLRLPMDRVVPRSVEIEEGDGTWKRLDPKRLYRVVMDLYAGKMVGYVSRVSKGILSVEPKDRNGKPLERLEDAILDGDGAAPGVQETKSWTSLAGYLKSFPDSDADGLPELPARYAAGEGRIVRRSSADFGELLDKARWTTRIAIGIGVLVVAGLVLGVSALAKRREKR
ncbi:MAG: 5'-nucleotidase C-terminal domain-containing protein, partial [Spirochaetaceae bacterium]|nr:5'-nucleotidase C-terminal domain-containing protein [Spirochaetaceae bacterium]